MNKQLLSLFFVLVLTIPRPLYSSLVPTVPIASIPINPFSSGFLSITAPEGIIVIQPKKKEQKLVTQPILVTTKGYSVTINGKTAAQGMLLLNAKNNEITVNGKLYTGPLTLAITPKIVTLKAPISFADIVQLTWGYTTHTKKESRPTTIKVLIFETPLQKQQQITIASDNGFNLINTNNIPSKGELAYTSLVIGALKNRLSINNKPMSYNQLHLAAKDGYAAINGTNYHGSFEIMVHDNHLLVINHVDLEEYVYSVLKSESWPGWPIEVNKAFAIASRSYVMAMIRQGGNKLPYHVKNTNAHQNYHGIHASLTIRTAVEQTRGVFLSYKNEPALAMFDCCCGGVIPAYIADFDFQKVPYLARTYPCTHCKRCKIYSWKKEFSLAEFGKKIAHLVDGSAQQLAIQDAKIGKKDKAGLVHELIIKTKDSQRSIPGKTFYAALKDIKSFCYSLHRKKDRLIFNGNGYGHHLGICQWGAREMVRDGWPYTRILSFYYPGTLLVKLPY